MIKFRILLTLLISQFLFSCVSIAPESDFSNSTPANVSSQPNGNSEEPALSLKADALQSPSGFRAEFVKLPGEGEGMTVIWKKGQKITEIPNSRPLSFSPAAEVLLLAEYAPDDDLRQYLLNIGEGEVSKEGSRINYVFGGRYLDSATWSADGKTITLHYHDSLSELRSETFKVRHLLKH